jgi:hypothetical protein
MTFHPMKTLSVIGLLFAIALPVGAQSFTGSIGDGSPLWDDFRPYASHAITVKERQMVTIRMTSGDFDTYLMAESPGGIFMYNDDYDGQEVSQIDMIAPEGGQWTIMAAGYDQAAGGDYTLEVTLGAIGEAQAISGRLDRTDALSIKGEFYDTHTVDITTDQPFHVELVALGFDGYLVARSPDGRHWRNDDAESMSTSRIGPLSGTGTWTFFVTSSTEGEVGAYDLNIITFP